MQTLTRPKLTRHGIKPEPAAFTDQTYYYNHVLGRRAPRMRYATAAEAFYEAKRLRRILGPSFEVRTYRAVEITEVARHANAALFAHGGKL